VMSGGKWSKGTLQVPGNTKSVESAGKCGRDGLSLALKYLNTTHCKCK